MRTGFYQRKDGRWEAYAVYTDPDTGEEDKKSFYSSKDRGQAAKRKLDQFVEKFENGDYSYIRKVTVEGWLNKYLEVYCTRIEQTTREGYERYINNHIIPEIGKIKLRELKPLNIQKFYNSEREVIRGKDENGNDIIGYSEKTILQEHSILHRAFEKAVVDGLLSKNPCDGADAPSPEDYEPTIYNEKDFALLLDKLKGHRMEAIVLIAGMCGLRRGELLGLTWDNIDLDNEVITVSNNIVPVSGGSINKKPKTTNSYRQFSISSSIIPRLKQLRGIGSLYLKLNGQAYNPSSVSRAFRDFLRKNNLKHIRLHDLRHFNCTMMLKYGVSEREAMERSGHSNSTMIKKYQHVLKDMDKNSADKLNNVLLSKDI
jgi:integrase